MKPNEPFDWGKDLMEMLMTGPRAPHSEMSIEELIANMKHNIEVLDGRNRND